MGELSYMEAIKMNRKHRITRVPGQRPYSSAGRPAICIATALVAFFALTATVPAPADEPLCDRLAAMVHFQRGKMDYLPAYGKVVGLFRRRPGIWWFPMGKILWRHPKRISALVYAIDHASHVAALRNQFLKNASLRTGFWLPAPHHWNYGSASLAIGISGYLRLRSGEFYLAGHKRRGARYSLAAMLLSAQAAPAIGRFALYLVDMHFLNNPTIMHKVIRLPPFSGVPSTIKGCYEYGAASLAFYVNRAPWRARFIKLHHTFRQDRFRAMAFYQPLDKLCHQAATDHGRLTAGQKSQMRALIEKGLRSAVDVREVFGVLSNAQFLQQRAAKQHQPWTSNAIRGDLAIGLAAVLKEKRFSPMEKAAIDKFLFELALEA